jgi:outer membrane protein OmpA-like peptidoglycan-associated protein
MTVKRNVFALIAALSVVALAYPGIGGGRGLFRVQNPLVEDQAGLSISLHAVGRYDDFGAGSNDLVADLVAPELNYAPLATRYVGLELFGSWGGLFQLAEQPEDAKQFDYGLHDLKAGAKLSIPIIPVLKLGASASYDFIGRNDEVAWLDPVAVPEAGGIAWTGLASLQLQDVAKALPNIMFNVGKRGDYDVYAAGIELAAKGFGLFVEGRSLQPNPGSDMFSFNFGDALNTETGEIRLTPGVAFGSATSGMTFKAGYTFGFGDMAHNELILGLSIATPFGRRTPPEIGTIVATVTDARTGAALAANISFPENPKMKPLTADPMTGVFKVEDVRAGIVVIDVAMEGYQRQSIPVNVEDDAVAQYEFKLRPLVTYGVIAGTVADAATRQPLKATIEFPGATVASVEADPATGAFKVEDVPVGIYTVKASAEGYYAASQTVTVEEEKVASPQFELVSASMKTTMTGKVSDKTSGKPLAATISFPGSDVPDVQTDPATGVYKTDVPAGSFAVKVTSEGYAERTDAVIAEKNKPLIRDFQLGSAMVKVALSGKVSDKKDGTALAATVSFPNTEVAPVSTDPATGVYMAQVAPGSYAVKVSSEGYIDQTAALIVEEGKPQIRDFALVKEGMSITLKGIYFDVNKTTIKPESRAALADAAQILKDNPTIRVEIQGHTDSQGSDEYNMRLSDGRAGAVVAYLVQNFGIDAGRLVAKGYGETMPIADNSTADGRSLNRRVEFVILGK